VSRIPKGLVERPSLNTYTSFEEFLGSGNPYTAEVEEEEEKVEEKKMRRGWFGIKQVKA
jgi:hypothetical protein